MGTVKVSEEMGKKTREAFDAYYEAKKASERFKQDPVEYEYFEDVKEAKRVGSTISA